MARVDIAEQGQDEGHIRKKGDKPAGVLPGAGVGSILSIYLLFL